MNTLEKTLSIILLDYLTNADLMFAFIFLSIV
ncbi:hypothetical protein SAMN04487777_11754 [Priestia aryabhattai B8W22]|nr:hypothetical protein SAMN04487777_11754 [Priestia aryabhattai B8W22]